MSPPGVFRIRTVTPVKRYDKVGCAEKEEIKSRISRMDKII